MITFCYITARKEPKFDWYIKGVSRQLKLHNPLQEVEFVIVDLGLDYEGESRASRLRLLMEEHGFSHFRHVPPKPCIWQGQWRKTQHNYYALANVRNTALCYANGDRIIFTDDCAVFDNDFLKYHLEAQKMDITFSGVQHKTIGMEIGDDGSFIKALEIHKDSREIGLGRDSNGFEITNPEWTYGANMSFSLESALAINGFDEKFDGQPNSEDCDFGIRLTNYGKPTHIHTKCIMYEDEKMHSGDSWIDAKNLKNGKNGRWRNEEICLSAIEDKRTLPVGNKFDIRELRSRILNGGEFMLEDSTIYDWRDGQLLCKM